MVFSNFYVIVWDWNYGIVKSSVFKLEGDDDEKVEVKKLGILVIIDVCLLLVILGEFFFGVCVFIYYDLFVKKVELYMLGCFLFFVVMLLL